MLRQGGRNQHFSLNEAVTLSQEQECQLGLKPDWTLSWKMYLGRHPLQKLKGSVKDILQRLCWSDTGISFLQIKLMSCHTRSSLIFSMYTGMHHGAV